MSVINGELNQTGIQALGTEFGGGVGAGHGAMINHTNGKIYCVFARNYLNGVNERRLYIAYSSNGGNTWSTPSQLTSGNWDDNPSGIQLVTSSTASDLGILFTRQTTPDQNDSPIIYRIGINCSTLALTTPVDPITGSPSDYKFLSLVPVPGGYAIFALPSAFSTNATVAVFNNSSFTTNTWTSSAISNFWGSSSTNPFSLSVRLLANGDLCAISAVRTNIDGSTTTGVGNMPRAILRLDVMVCFSADGGATWSSPQNLTNYSSTPALDLVGQTTAFDADIAQLTNGNIVVCYQEANAPQFLGDATTLALAAGAGTITAIAYHAQKNLLLLGANDPTNGGVYIYDLTGQTVTRLYTSSTPALWGNAISDIAISDNGTYIAVAHSLGLEIINASASSISSWTSTPIRSSTTPASRVSNMAFCQFDAGTTNLYVAYGAQSVANVWGFFTDASNPTTLTDLAANTGGNISGAPFILLAGGLYLCPSGGWITQCSKSTGAVVASTNVASSSWVNLAYDDINNEFLLNGTNGSNSGLHRVQLISGTFTVLQSFYPTSNPSCPGVSPLRGFYPVPGSGLFYQSTGSGGACTGFYSFGQQAPLGYVCSTRFDEALGENAFSNILLASKVIKTNSWNLTANAGYLQAVDMVNSGRARYGFFPYNTSTHQLTTSGINFYDVSNSRRVGEVYTKLQKLRVATDANNVLYFYFRKVDYTATTQQYGAVNAFVEPDAYLLTCRARIKAPSTYTLSSRGRIRTNPSHTISAKALIVFAQCLKIGAHITPRTSQSCSMRARILSRKTNVLSNTYLVSTGVTSRLRMNFYAGKGQVNTQNLQIGAHVVIPRSSRFTGYFIVYNNQSGALRLTSQFTAATQQTLGVRATITK